MQNLNAQWFEPSKSGDPTWQLYQYLIFFIIFKTFNYDIIQTISTQKL